MTNSEQRRLTNWRLKVLQAATNAGNVARTCRHFGLSRKTFYKWQQRYHQHGEIGLADRAREPHRDALASHHPRPEPNSRTKPKSQVGGCTALPTDDFALGQPALRDSLLCFERQPYDKKSRRYVDSRLYSITRST